MVQLARHWTAALPALECFVRAAIYDAHDADDVIQSTGEYLAKNFHQFDEAGSFAGWAISVARYRIKELYRDRSRDKLVLSGEALDAVAQVASDKADQVSSRTAALGACVRRLQPRQRTLLELCYLQGFKPAKIAERMGTKPNAVSAALLRIRKALRQCIEHRLRVDRAENGGAP